MFLSAFCHRLPFSFPDFVFVLKIGSMALIAPADLCHEFLHSPHFTALCTHRQVHIAGSECVSNTDMRIRVERYNGVFTDSKLKSRDHLFPAEVLHTVPCLSFIWKSVPARENEV